MQFSNLRTLLKVLAFNTLTMDKNVCSLLFVFKQIQMDALSPTTLNV